jgi:copper chaperone NosL
VNVRPAAQAALSAAILAAAVASGCGRQPEAPAPSPHEVSAEAAGHYCGMLLVDHEGPKGQIHLAGKSGPVWFSSVRDTIAFLRLPEEPRDITAVYVSDMAKATRWEQPDAGAWVDARQAWFVIESDRAGGMGAPEAVPFSTQAAAESFRAAHGGRVVRLDGIPDAYVFGQFQRPASGASGTSPSK